MKFPRCNLTRCNFTTLLPDSSGASPVGWSLHRVEKTIKMRGQKCEYHWWMLERLGGYPKTKKLGCSHNPWTGKSRYFCHKNWWCFSNHDEKKSVGCGISKFVCLLRGTSLIEIPSNPYSWWNSMYIPILSPFIHYIGTDSPSRLFACLLRTGSPLGDRKRVSSKQCPKAIGKEKYPLVNIQKAMERSTIFNGKIHYKWSFSIANC